MGQACQYTDIEGFREAVECLYRSAPPSQRRVLGENLSKILERQGFGAATRLADAYIKAGLTLLAALALRHAGLDESRPRLETRLLGCAAEIAANLPPRLRRCLDVIGLQAARLSFDREALVCGVFGTVYRDAMGELGERKGYAAYYTEPPAAHLLASLSLYALAQGQPRSPRIPRIADFACGTGMLLLAAYRAALGTVCGQEDCTKLVEDGIHGFEAQRFPAALASASLRLLEPGARNGPHITVMPLDAERGLLGSLELLEKWPAGLPESFDLVIMNPPFTSPTGRSLGAGRKMFGFAGRRSTGLLDKYRKILRRHVLPGLRLLVDRFMQETGMQGLEAQVSRVWRAGEALMFLYLAYRRVKPGGIVAFVLPRSLLTGASWLPARILLASEFQVRYIVVSSDPRRGYGFSIDAHDSEVLLVARRAPRLGSEDVVFVNLLSKPSSLEEAHDLAGKLVQAGKGARRAGNAEALVSRIPRERLLEFIDNWGVFVALPDPGLVEEVLNMLMNGVIKLGSTSIKIPVARLGDIASSIGVDRHQFHEKFKASPRGWLPGLLGGGEELRSKMLAEPNAMLETCGQGEVLFRSRAGRVLLPDRIRWDTAHVVAMYSQTPLLANMFYAARLDAGEEAEKALVYWLNTTWGMLSVLIHRGETEGAWSNIKIWQWRRLPVLDTTSLNPKMLQAMSTVFDRYSNERLGRIIYQFSRDPAKIDSNRLAIDLGFLKALKPGLDANLAKNALAQLYGRIALALETWLNR